MPSVCLLVTPWTAAHQAPLSVGFSRQEYESRLPCPPPGDLPHLGTEPASLTSPAFPGRFFITSTLWEALCSYKQSPNIRHLSLFLNHSMLALGSSNSLDNSRILENSLDSSSHIQAASILPSCLLQGCQARENYTLIYTTLFKTSHMVMAIQGDEDEHYSNVPRRGESEIWGEALLISMQAFLSTNARGKCIVNGRLNRESAGLGVGRQGFRVFCTTA